MRFLWVLLVLLVVACQQGNVTFVEEGAPEDYVPSAPVVDAPVQIEEPEAPEPVIPPPSTPEATIDIDRVVAQGTIFQDKYYMNRLQVEIDTDMNIEDLQIDIQNPYFGSHLNYTDAYDCERVTQLVRDAQRHFAGTAVNGTLHLCMGTPRLLQPGTKLNITIGAEVNETVSAALPAVLSGLEYQVYP